MSQERTIATTTLVNPKAGIDIMNIGRDLEKIAKTYQLEKWQEMSILAYVKVLEIMVKAAKKASPEAFPPEEMLSPDAPTQDSYTGSMFG